MSSFEQKAAFAKNLVFACQFIVVGVLLAAGIFALGFEFAHMMHQLGRLK